MRSRRALRNRRVPKAVPHRGHDDIAYALAHAEHIRVFEEGRRAEARWVIDGFQR